MSQTNSSPLVFKREYSLGKVEFIKYQLNQSINVPEPTLNETYLTVLAYIYVYKEQAKDRLLQDKILTSMNSIVNYIGFLKKLSYIDPVTKLLNPKIMLAESDFVIINTVKLDTTNEKVYHPYYKG